MMPLVRLVARSAILCSLLAFSVGCRFLAPEDVDGNDPVDVVRRFVEYVRTNDLAGAASCWREGDVSNIEANRLESFTHFCEYFQSETYTLRYEGADKGVYWVRFFGTDNGKTRAHVLYLDPPSKHQDRRWKLRESLWIKERGDTAGVLEGSSAGGVGVGSSEAGGR